LVIKIHAKRLVRIIRFIPENDLVFNSPDYHVVQNSGRI